MSRVYSDHESLLISFAIADRRVRLYLGLRDTRDHRRSPLIKQVKSWIQERDWPALAAKFPECAALAPYRPASPETTTFRTASERFLESQAHDNAGATVDFYRRMLKTHVWPVTEFANKALRLIGATEIVALYAPLLKRGCRVQAHNVRRTVFGVFAWAQHEHGSDSEYLVIDNPVARRRLPKRSEPKREEAADGIDPFTADEADALVKAAQPGWERGVVVVALYAGLRPNENFGLKRANLDFENNKIKVRQTFSRFGIGDLKNPRAKREVDMSERVREQLHEQRGRNEVRCEWLWAAGACHPLPHNPQNFSRRNWPALVKRAGVKHRNFYQCRHSFATMLLLGGVREHWIADQMGHADLTMLREVYWKWLPGRCLRRRAGQSSGPSRPATRVSSSTETDQRYFCQISARFGGSHAPL